MHGACGCIRVVGQVEIVPKMKAVNVFVLKKQRAEWYMLYLRDMYEMKCPLPSSLLLKVVMQIEKCSYL